MGNSRIEKAAIEDHRREMGERLTQLREEYSRRHGKSYSQERFGSQVLMLRDIYESHSGEPGAASKEMSGNAIKQLIGDWEGGHKDVPSIILQRYSQACGVSIDSIVNGEEFKPEPTNVTLKDLCRQIELLDRCRMIKTEITKDGRTCIEFCSADTNFGLDPFDVFGDYYCNAPRDYLIALRRFIEQYKIVKQIDRIPDSADVARGAMETLYKNIPERSYEGGIPETIELSAQAILDTLGDEGWYIPRESVDGAANTDWDMM